MYSFDTESKSYQPHVEIFSKTDFKNKTLKNGNICLSIVGGEYHDYSDDIQVGAVLTIKRDWGNIYDDEAYGYYTNYGTLVGYVPKREKPFVKLFMANGTITATVYNINGKFIDTVVEVSRYMVDSSEADKVGFMLVTKEKQYGMYTEGRRMISFDEFLDFL